MICKIHFFFFFCVKLTQIAHLNKAMSLKISAMLSEHTFDEPTKRIAGALDTTGADNRRTARIVRVDGAA